ncbi:hypothetical protein J437_LFUL016281 [Ladona fulva]|uniref:Uncharacterized protein n=1 Tax=Ladona fulva TaxID=123851 RepID=A0A8K0KM39_LADFU|nr:hypothetical protein J437_LFUL016281 [Ladona fulva]
MQESSKINTKDIRGKQIGLNSTVRGFYNEGTSLSSQEGELSGFKAKGEEENLKRLVLSEEMKNIKSEPIIPASLLTKLEKPSMALVLWQPPSGSVFKHLRSEQRFSNKESQSVVRMEEEEEQTSHLPPQVFNNNNTLALDLNSMDTGFSQVCRPVSMGGVDEMEC